jgi:hypothetical protein
LQALRNDAGKNFAFAIMGNESWFYYNYELMIMFPHGRDEVMPRVLQTRGLTKAMITVFFAGTHLLKHVHLPQRQKRNNEYFSNEIVEQINEGFNHSP